MKSTLAVIISFSIFAVACKDTDSKKNEKINCVSPHAISTPEPTPLPPSPHTQSTDSKTDKRPKRKPSPSPSPFSSPMQSPTPQPVNLKNIDSELADAIKDVDYEVQSQKFGLTNLGATCFANSVHKFLSVHPDILGFTSSRLINVAPETSLQFGARIGLYRSFHQLFLELSKSRLSADPNHKPKSAFYEKELSKIFDRYDHYLRKVNADGSNAFELDMKNATKNKYLRQHQIDSHEYLTRTIDLFDYHSYFKGLNLVSHLQEVNKNTPPTLSGTESISILDIPVTHEKSIQEAIQSFFLAYTVENGPPHNRKIDLKKLVLIESVAGNIPNQIIIEIKRYANHIINPAPAKPNINANLVKVENPIQISNPIELEVYPHSISPDQIDFTPPSKIKFTPTAVIVHSGNLNAGHYRAYTYDLNSDTWTLHDDTRVHLLKSQRLKDAAIQEMQTQGYLFLYTR